MRLKNWERYLVLTTDNRITTMSAHKHLEWDGIIALFEDGSPIPHHYKEFKKVLKFTEQNISKLLQLTKGVN